MITNLRESKARLSELVGRAAAGEEIVITVRGEPKAKLVSARPDSKATDLKAWAGELRRRHRRARRVKASDSSTRIIDELRAERW